MNRHYKKKPKTYEELAGLLMKRGLSADYSQLVITLKNIGYYRLSAYWYPFRVGGTDKLKVGTSLNSILNIYNFDTELRLLLFYFIHFVEIALRNRIMHSHVMVYGATGYKHEKSFPNSKEEAHKNCYQKCMKDMQIVKKFL